MTTCVFLGPTMPLNEARGAMPEAVFLPPARKGDIARAIAEHAPSAIGLIDGHFEQVPAIWHKEILWALDQGIEVWGAASMGALRACELRQFGMRGVGEIFQAYVENRFAPFSGPFEDDDEVAVVHGPEEASYLSTDAMVDIRATLAAAEADGVIDADIRDALAETAKAMFYKRRTMAAMLSAATNQGMDAAILAALRDWLPQGRVWQKKADAEALLRTLAGDAAPRPRPVFHFERTLIWTQSGLEPPFEPTDEAHADVAFGNGATS
ncbi:TfuA-like protein [Breoghania sp. L-A4]|uniref:TfuA-like protein n=1 Tax=Breoghania sp. L-A4 TaxID=2304600 RepID=UPI000E35C26C|nr:TfuA-like protein [Breoghania sp. L-A4]AXS40651.1 tfuA protein [Breoghania sp. L-A4]